MGVDDDSLGFAERDAQDDVGRLASHAGQFQELIHFFWHPTAILTVDDLRRRTDMFGLVAEEPRRMDQLFEDSGFSPGKGTCGSVFLE